MLKCSCLYYLDAFCHNTLNLNQFKNRQLEEVNIEVSFCLFPETYCLYYLDVFCDTTLNLNQFENRKLKEVLNEISFYLFSETSTFEHKLNEMFILKYILCSLTEISNLDWNQHKNRKQKITRKLRDLSFKTLGGPFLYLTFS